MSRRQRQGRSHCLREQPQWFQYEPCRLYRKWRECWFIQCCLARFGCATGPCLSASPGDCPISIYACLTHNLDRALLRTSRFASDTADFAWSALFAERPATIKRWARKRLPGLAMSTGLSLGTRGLDLVAPSTRRPYYLPAPRRAPPSDCAIWVTGRYPSALKETGTPGRAFGSLSSRW